MKRERGKHNVLRSVKKKRWLAFFDYFRLMSKQLLTRVTETDISAYHDSDHSPACHHIVDNRRS